MEFSKKFRSLIDISENLILIEFSGIPRLIKFSGFLRYKVDISRNLRLIDLSEFLGF
jgi:hypothetical protein